MKDLELRKTAEFLQCCIYNKVKNLSNTISNYLSKCLLFFLFTLVLYNNSASNYHTSAKLVIWLEERSIQVMAAVSIITAERILWMLSMLLMRLLFSLTMSHMHFLLVDFSLVFLAFC